MLLAPGSDAVLCGVLFGLVNASCQTGISLGIAVLGTLLVSLGRHDLGQARVHSGVPGPDAAELARSVLAGDGVAGAGARTGLGSARVQEMYGHAFMSGLRVAMLVAALTTFAAAVITLLVKPRASLDSGATEPAGSATTS